MSDYTPTTFDVKCIATNEDNDGPVFITPEQFDDWLTAHDHKVRAAALADRGKPQITDGNRPQRLNKRLRADLIDFAADRIQAVWDDVGETDAETLAENVVSAQEFAWMSAQVPIVTEQMVEDGARALAYRLADLDWPGTTVVSAPVRFEHRSGARAVLEAALGKGGE